MLDFAGQSHQSTWSIIMRASSYPHKYYNTQGNSMYLGIANAAGEVSTSREVGGWSLDYGVWHHP
jgi:hypothetical protein